MLSSKKAPIVFPTVVYTTAILLLISTFYLSLLSLQTVIYVPFFVFQKIAFTSSIVDPDQNARISVTSIVKFQDRKEIKRIKSDKFQYNTVRRWVDGTIILPSDGPTFILIDCFHQQHRRPRSKRAH